MTRMILSFLDQFDTPTEWRLSCNLALMIHSIVIACGTLFFLFFLSTRCCGNILCAARNRSGTWTGFALPPCFIFSFLSDYLGWVRVRFAKHTREGSLCFSFPRIHQSSGNRRFRVVPASFVLSRTKRNGGGFHHICYGVVHGRVCVVESDQEPFNPDEAARHGVEGRYKIIADFTMGNMREDKHHPHPSYLESHSRVLPFLPSPHTASRRLRNQERSEYKTPQDTPRDTTLTHPTQTRFFFLSLFRIHAYIIGPAISPKNDSPFHFLSEFVLFTPATRKHRTRNKNLK